MKQQRGAALLVALLILVLAASSGLIAAFNRRNLQIERDKITETTLVQAKNALMGYATSRSVGISGALVNAARPGDFPCPDLDGDGIAETDCGNGNGSTGQAQRLGYLPWKTLGLSDLRDSSGERLWYVVSSNFKQRYRYNAAVNSDTPGSITIRDASGNILRDAQAGQGVVAVIISPGAALTRPNAVGDPTPYNQSRDAAGQFIAKNYLDLAVAEDNADFTDNAQNGFIAGPSRNANGTIISNDRIVWITPEELAPVMEKRVIAEVSQCLREYTADPANLGRYPWPAASSLGGTSAVSYSDTPNALFGRIADDFSNTQATAPSMKGSWTGNCNINSTSGWWPNWKETIFYGIADAHKPSITVPTSSCSPGTPQVNCLSLNGSANRQFVVIAAGRRLASQIRNNNTDKNALGNYLENSNAAGSVFTAQPPAANFNDAILTYP